MAKYESKPAVIERTRDDVYERLSDLSRLQPALEALPEEQRAQLGDVAFEPDAITLTTAQVGQIKFGIIDRTPGEQLVFGTPSSPVPLKMLVNLKDGKESGTTESRVVIDIDIPMMLRPMIGGKMQQAADQMGDLIKLLCR